MAQPSNCSMGWNVLLMLCVCCRWQCIFLVLLMFSLQHVVHVCGSTGFARQCLKMGFSPKPGWESAMALVNRILRAFLKDLEDVSRVCWFHLSTICSSVHVCSQDAAWKTFREWLSDWSYTCKHCRISFRARGTQLSIICSGWHRWQCSTKSRVCYCLSQLTLHVLVH